MLQVALILTFNRLPTKTKNRKSIKVHVCLILIAIYFPRINYCMACSMASEPFLSRRNAWKKKETGELFYA